MNKQATKQIASKPKKRFLSGLRADLQFFPGERDEFGERTWVVFDPVTDRYFRLGEMEYEILKRLRTGKSLDELLDELTFAFPETTRKDVGEVVAFCRRNHLFPPASEDDSNRIEAEQERPRPFWGWRLIASYLAIRIPLWRPDDFLSRTAPWVGGLFNRWTLLVLAVIACWGYVELFPNWTRLKGSFFNSVSLVGAFNYLLAIVAVKFIHELSHAYCAKTLGVRAREFGVAFIIFLPRLYTDLTDSWRLADRKRRMLIGGAGIIAELIIGGIAALIWARTGKGPIHAVAYFLFTVSVINSLFFNGNPLMRFDGYYVLSDSLGIDNLQLKAFRHVKLTLRWLLWGVKFDEGYKCERRLLFLFYGVCAFVYRLFLYTSIIAVIYYKFIKVVGIILALMEVYLLIVRPCVREYKNAKVAMSGKKSLFYVRSAGYAAFLGFVLFWPWPWSFSIPCELRSAKREIVYAPIDGFVSTFYHESGDHVTRGAKLLEMDNPFLTMRWQDKVLERQILVESIQQLLSRSETWKESNIKQEQLKTADAAIQELDRKRNRLNVKAEQAGTLVLYDDKQQTGRWIGKGYAFGEIYDPDSIVAYAYVGEDKLASIKAGSEVDVCLEEAMWPFKGTVTEIQYIPLETLRATPLQGYRGGRLLGKGRGREWSSAEPLYKVVINPTIRLGDYSIGRSAIADFKSHASLAQVVMKGVLNFLQREFSF